MPITPLELLLEYVRFDTRSRHKLPDEEAAHPSTPGQSVLAKSVYAALTGIGVNDEWVKWLGDGSFIVAMPATEGLEEATSSAYAAHVDTYFGCPGEAKPIVHDYTGGDIVLPEGGIIIPAADLVGLEGKRIVTSDGTSLLGADDKAGVAVLVSVINTLLTENIPHGPLYFWFCVDEEIGEVGVKYLPDGMAQSWDILWTVDGKEAGTIDIGCFNGAEMLVTFIGNDAHPGVAGEKLRPAHYAAARFIDRLSNLPTPWSTSGDQAFYYAFFQGEVSPGKAVVQCFPRTFDLNDLDQMASVIRQHANEVSDEFKVHLAVSSLKVLYISTEEAIKAHLDLVAPAVAALERRGYTVVQERVRAGTDGAMLNKTYPGIPAPNLGTGARNLHGPREFLVVDEFEQVPGTILDMIAAYSKFD